MSTQVTVWQLMQLKAAIKLEKVGMHHSSGRSARMHAARALGMPGRPSHDKVIAALHEAIESLKEGV